MIVRVISGIGDAGVKTVEAVGATAIGWVEEAGKIGKIFGGGMMNLFILPLRVGLVISQLEFIGWQSLPIILLASAFTGAAFTRESWVAFNLFHAAGLVGGTVGVAVTKELGPTLTGLLVTGRAGSAMAAELGAMRVSEQIDALEAMAVDPINYLVKPRIIASTIAMPALCAIFDLVAIGGSYIVSVYVLHMSVADFMVTLSRWVDPDDIITGLIKATFFGLIMGTVSCYKGFYTKGGAVGVGRATTTAVVVSSVAILVVNLLVTWLRP